jgi:hypothetical protein
MHAAEPMIVDTDSLKQRPLPAHPPALYTVAGVAEPITVGEAILETSLARYREHGWLAVADVWSGATVATSARLLDELAAGRKSAAAERQLEATTGDEPAATSRVRKVCFSVMLAAEAGLPRRSAGSSAGSPLHPDGETGIHHDRERFTGSVKDATATAPTPGIEAGVGRDCHAAARAQAATLAWRSWWVVDRRRTQP